MFSNKAKIIVAVLVVAVVALIGYLVMGKGGGQQQAAGRATQVKVMNAIRQDTPISSEYAGQVTGKDEVKVQARVSGTVTEKYIKGGEYVEAGAPLYKIDSRQYESAVLQAQATLAQSEATLNNARIDLQRDQELLNSAAISEQTVTTQQALVNQYSAAVAANRALLKKAQENLDDTVIYAPMSGRLSVDEVAVGTYAVAGNTTLVTIGSTRPIYVTFNISETDYLKFMRIHQLNQGSLTTPDVTLTLSDGSKYPIGGQLVQADRALSGNTGTLTVKALFENPDDLLLPGMFARIKLNGEIIPNAVLVPQRAVQQLLGKSFVLVVGEDGKSAAKPVTLGDKVGSYYIIRSGITESDQVIVEGLTSLKEGMDLVVTRVTPEEMGFSLTEADDAYDPDDAGKSSDA